MRDGKKVILHVEDDDVIIMIYNNMLKKDTDYIILVAKSLSCARKMYNENKDEVDAIILDGLVLGGNTIEFAKNLRSSGFDGNMMANSGNDDLNEELMSAGCNLLCPKPTTLKGLLQILS